MKKEHMLRMALFITGAVMIGFLCAFLWSTGKATVKKPVDMREKIRLIAPYSIAKHRQALEEVVSGYERENPSIHIEVEYISREDYKRQIGLRQDEGNIADVIICDSSITPQLIKMGVFKKLPPDMVHREDAHKVEELWDSVQRDGIDYGAPLTCDPYVLFYDRDIFRTKELDVPETWDDVLAAGMSVKEQGGYGFGFSANDPEVVAQFFLLMLYSRGGDIYHIDEEAGVKSLTDIQEMSARKILPPNLINQNQEDLSRAFSQGTMRMMVNQMSMQSIWKEQKPNFSVGIAKLPGGSENFSFLTGDVIGLTNRASDTAGHFVEYIQREGVYERFCSGLDAIQARRGSKSADMENAEAYRLLETPNRAMVAKDSWFAISKQIAGGVLSCMSDESVDPVQIAEGMQETVRVDILEN